MQSVPQAKVGLLTDIHYDGGVAALNRLYEAVATLVHGGVDAMVIMGDLINATSEMSAKRLLREVAALCDSFSGPIHYMHGNHDLDHLSKTAFYNALGRTGDSSSFHFECGGYECICIDANFSPDGTEYDRGNFRWQESFVPAAQLDWLRGRLGAALLPVIILSHQRLDLDGDFGVANNAAVREMIQLSGKVEAVFQGHQHADDLKKIDGAAYYTLSAHVDDAGPAVVQLDGRGIRLMRDYQPQETVNP
ncbi:metallophosphoesterase family protein [Pontiella sulfatireligans]|uniref:Calcineurin-like phosphoesterase domain-containing protein n=1 Tax=Pontiella sulfatireligans TaxID=2750658 RepID=A0A6C2UNJ5_9BACT|nr:metallophosphoesterase [Pontiella sulfatireligans]VGO21835.1 hypothetical protein SCARR_03912 [Pontiella sulfatireligans]